MALHQGWWGAPYGQMLDTLTAHGLPKTLPAAFQPPAAGSGSAAMTNQPIAPAGTAWPLILAVLVGIGALVLTNAVVTRRRARLPA
jgi:1,4-dihydroxy-2-naphthoate octaprenyltransferase